MWLNLSLEDNPKKIFGKIFFAIAAIIFLIGGFFIFEANKVLAATITSTATGGDWNIGETWVGGVVPGEADTVTIASGAAVTVTANVAATSIDFLAGATSTLSINLGIALNISGAVTIPRATTGINTLVVGAGNLNAGSIAFTSGGSDVRHLITISTGAVTVTNDVTQAGSAGSASITFTGAGLLKLGGAFLTAATGTLAPSTGTVEYNSTGAQTVGDFTYNNLTLSGSGVKTTTTVIVNGILSMAGTATISATPTYGTNATLQYNTATARTAGAEWKTPFTATGGVIIANTGTITANTAKVFNSSVPLTINSGATLNPGGFTHTISGGATLTVNGTLDFSNASGEIRSGTSGASTLTMGSNGLIRTIDANGFGPAINASFSTQAGGAWTTTNIDTNGTIEYYRSSNGQTVTDRNYNSLTITNAQTKTWTLNGTRVINGNVTINSGAPFTLSGAPTVNIKGNWSNSGTFTPGVSAVNFNGATQTINNANTWYNLSITGTMARTVTLQSGAAQTVVNELTLTGSSGQLLTLASLASSTKWQINVPATQNISYVSASYSDASGGTVISAANGTNINGGNNTNWNFLPPNSPSSINQYQIGGTTVITQGTGSVNQTQVVFKATATDTDGNQYKLEVEVLPHASSYMGVATCASSLVNSGSEASTGFCGAFTNGLSYKWQYRLTDSAGASTAWTVFGGTDPDFTIDTTPPFIIGLNNDTAPTNSKTWNWDSDDAAAIYRFAIYQSSEWTLAGDYSDIKTASQSSGDGVFYLYVQAKDSAGNESSVTTVSAMLDNTAPTVIKLGDDSAVVALSVGETDLVFSEILSASSKTAVENALTAGADKALSYVWPEAALTITATETITFANDVVVKVADVAGNTATLLIVDSKLADTQTTNTTNNSASGAVPLSSSNAYANWLAQQRQVLGVKIENSEISGQVVSLTDEPLKQILIEAAAIYSENINTILANDKAARDSKVEKTTVDKYLSSLTYNEKDLLPADANRLNFFITYGTLGTKILGAGERAGVLNSYKFAFGKLPKTETEWQDAVKIASSRWPSAANTIAEAKAKVIFKKIYDQEADLSKARDVMAIKIIAYGLRPAKRNLDSEKAASKSFKFYFKKNPTTTIDWDAVRGIVYYGAKR